MCNRKTKQWHIKPKLAEYKTRTVYCIVNELKMVPSETEQWSGHRAGDQWASCWPWLWSHEGMEEPWAEEPGVHNHLRFATSGTGQFNDLLTQVFICRLICTQTASLQNCSTFKRETEEDKEWSWAPAVAVMQAFHIPLELKRCG